MLIKHKIKLLIRAVVVVGFLFVFSTNNAVLPIADNKIALAQVASPSVPVTLPSWELLDKIVQAKQLLAKSTPLKFEERAVGRTKKELVRKQIAVALLDKTTGNVFERRVWVEEKEIKNYPKTALMTFVPENPDDPIDIQPHWWNSFNTFFEVKNAPNLVIVADKYLLLSDSVPNKTERSKDKYTEIIYSPYSEAIHDSNLAKIGRDYVDKQTDLAFDALKNLKVKSKSSPGKLASDVVSKEFVKNIIIVEHVDPDGFAFAYDGGKLLTERVLVIIGANQERAYVYTGSNAGAIGLAQFIRLTYNSVRLKYPEARLIPDFGSGMADHLNAIKAMVLFFDIHSKDISDRIARKSIIKQLGGNIPEEMLAAAYNGGPTRVVKSVNRYGLAWIDSQLNNIKPRIFRAETLHYLEKFIAIKNLHIFD